MPVLRSHHTALGPFPEHTCPSKSHDYEQRLRLFSSPEWPSTPLVIQPHPSFKDKPKPLIATLTPWNPIPLHRPVLISYHNPYYSFSVCSSHMLSLNMPGKLPFQDFPTQRDFCPSPIIGDAPSHIFGIAFATPLHTYTNTSFLLPWFIWHLLLSLSNISKLYLFILLFVSY